MENLFDYADKELAQDAFLRWLFSNWQEEDFAPLVKALLKEFCGLSEDENIKDIQSWAQWQYIDLTFYIYTDKTEYALFIEDKAFTSEHNQLKTYDTKIANIEGKKTCKIFYKTSKVKDVERKRVEKRVNADGETENTNWRVYDIFSIAKLLMPYKDNKNLIIKQYIEYICKLMNAAQSSDKPTDNSGNLDYIKWESYFRKVGTGVLKKYGYIEDNIGKSGHYPYVSIVFQRRENEPYLEIRSRDCVSKKYRNKTVLNPFVARILFYGADNVEGVKISDIIAIQNKMIEKIKTEGMPFDLTNARKSGSGFSKQIGKYRAEKIDTDEKFIAELEKCAILYNELMKVWDSFKA